MDTANWRDYTIRAVGVPPLLGLGLVKDQLERLLSQPPAFLHQLATSSISFVASASFSSFLMLMYSGD